MPYPNEHSARLKEPNSFDPKTFRRVSGGTIYGSIKVPKTISIIWGKLKTANKPKDNPIPQALRFPVKNWTAEKAKKWLKDNKVKYIKFEAASGKKENKNMEQDDKFRKPAPIEACIFVETEDAVRFADEDRDNEFVIIGYSGEIIPNHWYWGNLAFDLKGIKFAKKNTPVLEEHTSSARIGVTTKQEKYGQVRFEGKFLNNDKAQSLRKDMQDGFPMEASLYIKPLLIEQVTEGQTAKVNGKILEGPGAVFRKSVIKETSMCLFGADSNTMSKAFADGGKQEIKFEVDNTKENQMSEQEQETTELTAEIFAADNPDLYQQITANAKAEGEKKAKELFDKFAEKFGDDPAFIIEQFRSGKTIEEATEEYAKKMKAERDVAIEKANKATEKKVDPAVAEFSDDQGTKTTKKEPADTEEGWKKEFAESKELQDEFKGDEKAYIAFKKAENNGRVRVKS